MKKRDLLVRIEELERRARDLEMQPRVIVVQPSDPFQPWQAPFVGDPINVPTITWGGTNAPASTTTWAYGGLISET